MALFKSSLLAQASGSVGGTVYSHNRGGAYIRNRALVSNPNTDRQQAVRSAMSALSKMWGQSLTQPQRDSWTAYAANRPVTNRLGDSITLSGIAMFLRVNQFGLTTLNAVVKQNPPTSTLPPGTEIPAYFSSEGTSGGPGSSPDYQIVVTSQSLLFGLAVYYNPSISAGIGYYKGPYPQLNIDSVALLNTYEWSSPVITSDVKWAAKATLFEISSGVPEWTVFIPPQLYEGA